MVYLTRKAEFSASHYYHNPDFTPEENLRTFGKCNNPHGHGHNYTLEVTVKGDVDPRSGFVVDLKQLKDIMHREVLDAMDHRFLNKEVRESCHFHLAAPRHQNAKSQTPPRPRLRNSGPVRRLLWREINDVHCHPERSCRKRSARQRGRRIPIRISCCRR
jgi:6-pyruvoyl tetrahydropterin synthase/QueD family protein